MIKVMQAIERKRFCTFLLPLLKDSEFANFQEMVFLYRMGCRGRSWSHGTC